MADRPRQARNLDRRQLLVAFGALAMRRPLAGGPPPQPGLRYAIPHDRWVFTTETRPWQLAGARAASAARAPDIRISSEQRFQTIDGFGGCFNEMGWDALRALSAADRQAVFEELFGDGGAGFARCRMPIGANDFSRDWYSYDETPGDFALARFDLSHDDATLVPYVRMAQRVRPNLRLWASPWSPPTWMKTNGHYAAVPNQPGWPDNGIGAGQHGAEGTDMFRQEPRYLDAYARYFGHFIDGYAMRGIRIDTVMPQNEFNSAQAFPSCCWTPAGLARFLPYLAREMTPRGVDILFGTMERPDPELFEAVYRDPAARAAIKGVGLQWAGRAALPLIAYQHPSLRYWMTEQECGDGRNDWRYALHAWDLMRFYLGNGCSVYDYWNMALVDGGVSRWGWAQNSLLSVDPQSKRVRWNHDYHVLKHVAGLVRPGAQRIAAVSWTGYEDVLAFRNVDGSVAIALHNPLAEPMPLAIDLDGRAITVALPPGGFGSYLASPMPAA